MKYSNINKPVNTGASGLTTDLLTGRFLPFLLIIVPALPPALLADIPQRDALTRYAPMAQAMLEHNRDEAFHAGVPFLFPAFGALCPGIFHCGVLSGLKIASVLCVALTAFPLWEIFRRVFNERTARFGCLFFVFCSYWLRIASSGTRESAELLFFTIAVLGLIKVFQERRSLGGYLPAGGESISVTPEQAPALGLRAAYLVTDFEETAPEYPGCRLLDVRRGQRRSYAPNTLIPEVK